MLIDYVAPHKLPDWLVWLDWCFYAYKMSFFILIGIAIILWVILCYFKQGYPAVG